MGVGGEKRDEKRASMSLFAVVAIGIGSMVGAGIFALLGQTALMVGRDTWLAFAVGGGIALFSGACYAGLSARYPGNGGIVDFLNLALPRRLAATLSILYLINLVIATAMIAKTFGDYFVSLAGWTRSMRLDDIAGCGALVLIFVLSAAGRSVVGKAEIVLVGIKLLIMFTFLAGGLWFLDLSVGRSHQVVTTHTLIAGVGLTFFAYAGFGMMANAAGNVAEPARTMRIAFPAAILVTAALYISLALIVLSAIPPEELAKSAETAVAVAARPFFGNAGFTIMAFAALLATASTINANIYSGNEMSRSLAKSGQIPSGLGKPFFGSSTYALLGGIALVIVMVNLFDLATVANAAGAVFLIIYLMTFVVAWRMRRETKTHAVVIAAGFLVMSGVLIAYVVSLADTQPYALGIIVIALLLSATIARFADRSGRLPEARP